MFELIVSQGVALRIFFCPFRARSLWIGGYINPGRWLRRRFQRHDKVQASLASVHALRKLRPGLCSVAPLGRQPPFGRLNIQI